MNLEELKESKRFKNVKWDNHNKETIISLEEYVKRFHTITSIERLNNLITLLEHDYSIYDIEKRIKQIIHLKRDSTSKNSFIIRYGEKIGNKKWKERNNRLKETSSRSYLEHKLGYEKANKILKSKCPNSKKNLKEKYPNSWEHKLYEYKKNYSFSNSKEGYILKYGEKEGKKRWKERIKRRKIANSEEGYILKYGEKEGKKRWKEKGSKHSYRMSKQYYVDTYGEKLGSIICAENSIYGKLRKKYGEKWFENFLNEKNEKSKKSIKIKFIEKYGEKEGLKKYKEYIRKQRYAHSIDYYIEKYGENEGIKKYKESRLRIIHNITNGKRNKSNISIQLFENISNNISQYNEIFYNGNNGEKFLKDNNTNKLYFYDFTYKNKIIEFHGDFWHMNPEKYNKYDKNKKTNTLACDIWEYDKYKKTLAEENNFKVLIIWESEYKKSPHEILQKCLNFLNYE